MGNPVYRQMYLYSYEITLAQLVKLLDNEAGREGGREEVKRGTAA